MKRLSFGLGLALSLFAKAALAVTIYLTSGTTWTVPQDWNSQDNKIQIIGHGGQGGDGCSGVFSWGGGGGAYVSSTNVSMVPGSTVSLVFGVPAIFVPGSTSIASTPAVIAANGNNGYDGACSVPGQGGQASASTGAVKFNGGNGARGDGGGAGTGPGGGAAGPHGTGANGTGGDGGAADAGFGGAGGTGASLPGGNGAEFDASHGAGGGGGSLPDGTSGVGGNYGGGGGFNSAGGPGLIVITYTPHKRISSGTF